MMNTARGESVSFSQELGTCCPHAAARELFNDTEAQSFQVTWGALSHTVAGVPCEPGELESHSFGDCEKTNLTYAFPCPTVARFYPTVSLKGETVVYIQSIKLQLITCCTGSGVDLLQLGNKMIICRWKVLKVFSPAPKAFALTNNK